MEKLPTNLPSASLRADSEKKLSEATWRSTRMIGCFRKGDANDPKIWLTAVIGTLVCYPIEVIREVTDPVVGMPSRFKWLPTIAEVREECETIVTRRTRALVQSARVTRQLTERIAFENETADRAKRLSYEELKEKYGDWHNDWNSTAAKAEEARATLIGEIGQEAFDALPDAPAS